MRPQAKGCARPPGVGRDRGAFPQPPEGLAPPRLRSRAGEDSRLSSCLGAHRRPTRHGLWPGRGASGERAAQGDQRVFWGRGQGGRGAIRDGPQKEGTESQGAPRSGRVTCGNTAGAAVLPLRPRRTLSCSSRPALACSSSSAPERGLALPSPRAVALAPSPTLPRASARVPSSRPPARKAGFSLLPTWYRGRLRPAWAARHRLHNRETRGCGSLGTGHLVYSLLRRGTTPPASPGCSHPEGCLPGGISPADLAACPQGSWECLPAAHRVDTAFPGLSFTSGCRRLGRP